MDRAFTEILPRVQMHVQGCPYPTVLEQINEAARRACERTLLWRYEVPKYLLTPAVHQYYYNKPANADVHAVFGVTLNGRPMQVLTLEQAILKHPAWADLYSGEDPWALTAPAPSEMNESQFDAAQFNEATPFDLPPEALEGAGTPSTFTQITPDKYIVLPLPNDTEYWMRMWVALKPKRTATGMEEVAFHELEDVIIHGALQTLFATPSTWKDLELATYHAKQFTFHLSERRARANLTNARGTLVAHNPRGWL